MGEVGNLERLTFPKHKESTVQLNQQRLDEKLTSKQSYSCTETYEIISLHEAAKEDGRGSWSVGSTEKAEILEEVENKRRGGWTNIQRDSWEKADHEPRNPGWRMKMLGSVTFYTNSGRDMAHIQTVKLEDCRKYYKNLLQKTRHECPKDSPTKGMYIQKEVTLKKTVMSLKNDKASGPEGRDAKKLFGRLTYNVINAYTPEPEQWETEHISSIYKKREMNQIAVSIEVISIMSRQYGRALRDLIQKCFEMNEEEEQSVF